MAFPYQPYYGYNPMQLHNVQQVNQQTQPQMQNGGFISVRSQKEAWDYPIAPGNSITFIDENAMRCYIKSKGFSPFEQPKFDTYRLVKEEPPKQAENAPENSVKEDETTDIKYDAKAEIDAITERIDALKDKVDETIKRVDFLSDKIDSFSAKKQKPKREDDDE